ncbi:polysaccharide polymerase [Lacticaseibacillus paracasei subsp. paracasei Lpp126]|uniref:Polysaccharide polymerase n=1 Tax=Lacticaseibacillus paracasei subsp. paracasei Lpp126 TaxID=1256206 RepID=S2R0I4_LACPA|nr:polysaccharide polymerase [Lacticaseibacillus paracasei subsp. paracasei Lpp126]
MIYLLLLCLLGGLSVAFILNNRDVFSPSFVFAASFVFCTAWAVAFSREWGLGLHSNTFWVLFLGVFEYIAVATFIHALFVAAKPVGQRKRADRLSGLTYIQIDSWKKIVFIIFELLTVAYISWILMKEVGTTSLPTAISTYRNSINSSIQVYTFPKPMVLMRTVTNASGYWFIYVMINNRLATKKNDYLVLSIVLLSIVSWSMLGGRNNVVNLIIGFIAILSLLIRRKNGKTWTINFKGLLVGIIVGIICLYSFQLFGSLLGRTSDSSPLEYLAKYCGAEIKNLDLFIRNGMFPNKSMPWGSQTFVNFVRLKVHYNYPLTLPFQSVNGFNLGNVYTTFYAFLYDFGYIGVGVLTAIMAAITQIVYEIAKLSKSRISPSIFVVIYGFFFSSIALSFFSDKFYEQNFLLDFAEMIILWNIFNVVFCNFNFSKSAHKITQSIY